MSTYYCKKCKEVLDPYFNYCPFCGVNLSANTISPFHERLRIDEFYHCFACGSINPKKSLYCSQCGKYLFKMTSESTVYCPKCQQKNSPDSDYCLSCGFSFNDWFGLTGEIAGVLGVNGNITFTESMNKMSYSFLEQEYISFGRKDDNDISIPCKWISSEHCKINCGEWNLVDTGSSNGTYVNRSDERINKLLLDNVNEFNIAGTFTFSLAKSENYFAFRLTAVLDESWIETALQKQMIDELRNTYFIICRGDCEIKIGKSFGDILTGSSEEKQYISLHKTGGYYYFSDLSRSISKMLITNKNTQLPNNWSLLLEEKTIKE